MFTGIKFRDLAKKRETAKISENKVDFIIGRTLKDWKLRNITREDLNLWKQL